VVSTRRLLGLSKALWYTNARIFNPRYDKSMLRMSIKCGVNPSSASAYIVDTVQTWLRSFLPAIANLCRQTEQCPSLVNYLQQNHPSQSPLP